MIKYRGYCITHDRDHWNISLEDGVSFLTADTTDEAERMIDEMKEEEQGC